MGFDTILFQEDNAGAAATSEGAIVGRPTRAKLEHQASTEDEATNDAVLLVLSVRLKTPKSN